MAIISLMLAQLGTALQANAADQLSFNADTQPALPTAFFNNSADSSAIAPAGGAANNPSTPTVTSDTGILSPLVPVGSPYQVPPGSPVSAPEPDSFVSAFLCLALIGLWIGWSSWKTRRTASFVAKSGHAEDH